MFVQAPMLNIFTIYKSAHFHVQVKTLVNEVERLDSITVELMEQDEDNRQGHHVEQVEAGNQETFTISKSAVKRRKSKPTGVVILT